ncbi:MAG TPA: AAA family ATPase [Pyrinomonadaceae bacterium]|nr:AAA family ATPase [Pyrinomonadaceae bacterium]
MAKDDGKAWPRGFPKELLKAKAEERISWFENRALAHETINNARVEIRRLLRGVRRHPVTLVVGPTGVGKSTLMMLLKRQIVTELLPSLTHDRGRIPIVSVEASAPESGVFNWRDHYIKCLMELRDVLIFNKIKDDDCDICHGKTYLSDNPRLSAPSFRHALEHALVHRRPAAFFIDEAQHLTKLSSGRRLLDQMDILKSIANCTQIPHVLFGTYDLLTLRHLNGQLSRRNSEIHFARYKADDKKELAEFKKVLRSFENLLPLKEKPSLESQWEFIYERSLGCVGILKDWLSRALELALDDDSAMMSSAHLERAAMSIARCHTIAKEIVKGEERLAEDNNKRSHLLSMLGLIEPSRTPRKVEQTTTPVKQQSKTKDPSPLTSSIQRARPFEQKPKRHATSPKTHVA